MPWAPKDGAAGPACKRLSVVPAPASAGARALERDVSHSGYTGVPDSHATLPAAMVLLSMRGTGLASFLHALNRLSHMHPVPAVETCSPAPAHPLSRRCVLLAALAVGAGPAAARPLRLPIAISDVGTQRFPRRVLALVAEGEGIEWDIRPVPWPRMVAMAQQGEALAFGLSPTPRRQPMFAFSEPLYDSRVWALSHRQQPPALDRADDLRGLAVCAGRGVSYGESIDNLLAESTQTSLVLGDVALRARLVMAQRCDVALFSSYAASSDALERKLRQRLPDAGGVVVHRQPLATWSTHIAVRRGHPLSDGLDRINRAIRRQHRAILALVEAGR